MPVAQTLTVVPSSLVRVFGLQRHYGLWQARDFFFSYRIVLSDFSPEAPPLFTFPSSAERVWLDLKVIINLFLPKTQPHSSDSKDPWPACQ